MADSLIAPDNDKARQEELASRFFYLVGDIFKGADAAPRVDASQTGGPLLGPRTNAPDYGVGQDGAIFRRGSSGTVGTTNTAPAAGGGITLSLPMLLLLGLGLFLALKH